MKKILVALLLCGTIWNGWAQDKKAIKYADILNPESAKEHLSILASDAFEGRETGKRGAELAGRYIAAEFKKIGLVGPVKGSFFQPVGLVESQFKVKKFQINNQHFLLYKDFYLSGSTAEKKIKAEQVVFAGFGISSSDYDDLKDLNITGKVVLISGPGEPFKNGVSVISKTAKPSEWATVSSMRIKNLQAKKPALILVVYPNLARDLAQFQAHLGEPTMSLKDKAVFDPSADADVVQITPEAADVFLKRGNMTYHKLIAQINETGFPQSQVIKSDFETVYGVERKNIKAENVLGYLEGTDLKDEVLVISAHYDHVGMSEDGLDKIFNGADDDGSGTTAVLEIARAFVQAKKDGNGPRRSILFLAVVGEEKGLLGSEWYSDNPVFPLVNTVSNLNIDMIGRVDSAHKDQPDYCYLIGSDKLSTQLHKTSEYANATYAGLKIDYKYNDPKDSERIYYRSDHYNFAKHGIPVIFYFSGIHEDYHKVSDEVNKINFPLLIKRAKLIFHTAWEIANQDKRPIVDVTKDMPQSK